MNKHLIPLTAAAYLAMTAALAADPGASIPPSRLRAAHPTVALAVSSHHAAGSASATATPDVDAGFNRHVVLWRSIDVPGAVNGTAAFNINDLGQIAGVYLDSKNNNHAFVRKVGGEIVTFDAPNVGYGTQAGGLGLGYGLGTSPTGINNQGDVIGYYTDAAGAYHGFVRSARGKFTIIDDPSSTSSPTATIAQAINDWGEIVGFWFDSSGNYHGFVRQVDGSFIPFEPPGALYSQGYHINDRGEVGGDWTDVATGTSHGMLRHPDGTLVTFDAPNAVNGTYGGLNYALNLEGNFTGTYVDANFGTHGYVRYANGTFAEFTAPSGGDSNYNGTWGVSLNSLGTVVGYSYESNGTTADGYVRFADGTLIIANAPVAGQQSTFPSQINDLNVFTGYWNDANGALHGFVALAVR